MPSVELVESISTGSMTGAGSPTAVGGLNRSDERQLPWCRGQLRVATAHRGGEPLLRVGPPRRFQGLARRDAPAGQVRDRLRDEEDEVPL